MWTMSTNPQCPQCIFFEKSFFIVVARKDLIMVILVTRMDLLIEVVVTRLDLVIVIVVTRMDLASPGVRHRSSRETEMGTAVASSFSSSMGQEKVTGRPFVRSACLKETG